MEYLLPILVIVFVVIIAVVIYMNWPAVSSAVTPQQTCQSCGEPPKRCGCPKKAGPCDRCGMPKPQCGCPQKQACEFC